MNISPMRAGLAAVGVVALAGGLSACKKKNEGETPEGVANNYVALYDSSEDRDNKLDLKFETTRSVVGTECVLYDPEDFSCRLYDSYTTKYSIAALAERADAKHGNGDGDASSSEIAEVVREFDKGPNGNPKSKAIANNGVLEKTEIDLFNKTYDETQARN